MATPAQFNAAVGYDNLADDAFVRASSAAPFLPVGLLKNRHIGRKWRGNSNPQESLFLDLGASVAVDTVALMGCNMGPAGTMRLRGSNTAADMSSGVIVDETFAGVCDPAYGYQIGLLGAEVEARYWRIDLEQAGLPYIEAGRLFLGAREQFAINFSYDWSYRWNDRSRKTTSRGGQTYVDRDNSFRTFSLAFNFLEREQRYGFVEELDREHGAHEDVLFIADPTHENIGQVTCWGLAASVSPVSQPFFEHFSKAYEIEERL